MKVIISARKVNLRENFKERVQKKLSKFDRIFDEDAIAHVTVSLEKNRQTVEITIHQRGLVYRAESTTLDMNEALDNVLDALGRQIRKNKSRIEKRLRSHSTDEYATIFPGFSKDEEHEDEYKIVRSKRLPVKPLDVEEAILQMNLVGHQFFMFLNAETGDVNLVYRRKNGSYGLLEPEADE